MSPMVGMVGFFVLAVLLWRPIFLARMAEQQQLKQRRETQVLAQVFLPAVHAEDFEPESVATISRTKSPAENQ